MSGLLDGRSPLGWALSATVGGVHGQLSVAALIEECSRPGLPGMVPSERFSLAAVPAVLLAELERARRGVVVLAVDGVSHAAASSSWAGAEITFLTSTFPSTSATAWLTALTGRGPRVHGVPGMVYRVGGTLVYAVTGERVAGTRGPRPDGAVRPQPTVFERATGARCLVLGRELDHLGGEWAAALVRGAAPVSGVWRQDTDSHSRPVHRAVGLGPADLAGQAGDPELLAETIIGGVTAVLTGPATAARATAGTAGTAGTVLLWVYVNFDEYIHDHGYDGAVLAALRRLDGAARGWAEGGWTVVAHSDHGQVPVRPDPALAAAWAEVDDPRECELPAGGAGRVRWLHPRPGREDAVRARLSAALGGSAVVFAASELPLPPHLRLPPERAGAVVAVAASPAFPVPNPRLRFEHGGLDVDEMVVPLGVWRPSGG